jgi:hypothetical protein
MVRLADYEYVTFAVTLVALWLGVELGAWMSRRRPVKQEEHSHLALVTNASISILALIIAFSFSAAIGRYDQRIHYEHNEASLISTQYDLAGLLPDDDARELRGLIAQYVQLRVDFYRTPGRADLIALRSKRIEVEHQMWPIVQRNAKNNPSPVTAQVVKGLADMVSSADFSLAAAEDRIPDGAWTLMAALSFLSCVLIGYGEYGRQSHLLRMVLPTLVGIAFFFIASLDAQRRGLIRVEPVNLLRVQREIAAEEQR